MDANTSGLWWPLAELQTVFGASRSSAELLEASHTERTCEVDSESVSKQTDEERGPSGILKLKLNTGRFKFNPLTPEKFRGRFEFLGRRWDVSETHDFSRSKETLRNDKLITAKDAWSSLGDDISVLSLRGMLFYSLFSLFPTILLLVSLSLSTRSSFCFPLIYRLNWQEKANSIYN